jgi:glucose-6-phosphate dehydrogenase assembly protein OpcA
MSAASAQQTSSHAPRKVALDTLEAELVKLWRHPKDAEEIRAHAIRACMSNLIVYHRSGGRGPQDIDQTLMDIVHFHPCRILLLLEESGFSSPEPEAFISTHVDSAQQVFCEQITFKTNQSGLARLPSLTRPLILSDLPTSLWLSVGNSTLLAQEWMRELTNMVDQIIYDSFTWSDAWGEARQGLIAVTDWLSFIQRECSAADVAWRRLRPWRRITAQALDPAAVPGALQTISEVTIEHGPHALPQAWLFTGWMAQRLGWRPQQGKVAPAVEITWNFDGPAGPVKVTCRRLTHREHELTSAVIAWRQGTKTANAKFTWPDDRRLRVSYEGIEHPSRVMAVPRRSLGEMIARQLPEFGHDPLFEQTLNVARAMASAMEA